MKKKTCKWHLSCATASAVRQKSITMECEMDIHYNELRKELRAFCPDRNTGECKSKRQLSSVKLMQDKIRSYAQIHPECQGMELRKYSYGVIGEHFEPFLFKESPFYFEAGVNGGWSGQRPGPLVRSLCAHIYADEVPVDAMERRRNRGSQRYILCCGTFTDEIHHIPPLTTILETGFKGVWKNAKNTLAKCQSDKERDFVETAIAGLETIHAMQLKFAAEARRMLATEDLTPWQRASLERIQNAASRVPWEPPQTFFEGLNTLWFVREILGFVDGLSIFALGRPDAMLFKLYEDDLASGRLTKDEAYDLICRFLVVADCHYDGMATVEQYTDHELEIPLTLGGCDSTGAPVFNDLTRMFLKAHQALDIVYPKLHCRFSADSPGEYLAMIAQCVHDGHCVFAMFNDDRNIPALAAMGIPIETARNYIGTGCWDGYVDSCFDVDTANYFSLARVLEAMIYEDPEAEKQASVTFKHIDECKTFQEISEAFISNFTGFLEETLADYTRYGKLFSRIDPHPAYSACMKGCLETRRDTTEGGVLFKPRIITLAFLANVVDSLCAINELCFVRKSCTLAELLAAVRSNWKDAENLRAQAMCAPHWGDDTPVSNSIMRSIFDNVSKAIENLTNERGGKYHIAAWIYREFRFWGEKMRALPDGRHDGDLLSQGLVPSEFRCKEDITTVLNAISSLDHSKIFASNVNISFDKSSVTPEALTAVFRSFAARKIQLLQPNCFSREDLLDAQRHPEKHTNIIIKVCGFSARFVSLSKAWQDEVLARHVYR